MKKRSYITGVLILVSLVGFFAYFIFYTPKGSQMALRQVLDRFDRGDELLLDSFKGNLVKGMTLENLELVDLKYLPEGARVKIQKVFFDVNSLSPEGVTVKLDNARLKTPHSDTVVIDGTFQQGRLNFNIYGNSVDLREVLDAVQGDNSHIKKIKGEVIKMDAYLEGPYGQPAFSGSIEIKELAYGQFSLRDAPVSFKLSFEDQDGLKIKGKVDIHGGTLLSRRTRVNIQESSLLFDGSLQNPGFDLRGEADIETTKIHILVKGTKDRPDLWLSSDPPLPQEQLLVMLATGKRWQGLEDSLKNSQLTDDVAEDFIDYFLFSGKGEKFLEYFGIKEVSVIYNEQTRGIGVKKGLTDKIDVGYGLERDIDSTQEEKVKQKVEGEYHLNEKLSVGLEKEIMYDNEKIQAETNEVQPGEEKVFMKFKTKF